MNFLASLLAKDRGVKDIITVANRSGFGNVLKHIGLDKAISPRNETAKLILEFIHNGNILTYPLTEDGKTCILEIYTGEKFTLKGRKLKDIKFPSNTLVCSIIRQEDIFVPGGENVFQSEDIVVIITLKHNIGEIRRLFQS